MDEVKYYYKMTADPQNELTGVFQSQSDFLVKSLKQPIAQLEEREKETASSTSMVFFAEEEQEVRT